MQESDVGSLIIYLQCGCELPVCAELQCDVITNQDKRSPMLNFIKLLRFSHAFHGLVQRFAGTFTAQ